MLQVTINGQKHECREDQTILTVLRNNSIAVPTLCHDPRLTPIGGCRLCVVDVKGCPRPLAACTTQIADGMEIQTHTPELETLRQTLLRLLAREYPKEAIEEGRDNEFHRLIAAYELQDQVGACRRAELVDDSHPTIHVDMSQCIHCFRCVRICEEVAGQFVWKAWNRGDRTEIRPDGKNLLQSPCVSCGACVDTCPTGALSDRNAMSHAPPVREVRTVCPYCGTGCEMHVGSRNGKIVSVRPAMDALVNKGHLCVKGRYGYDFVDSADRITHPMIREGDQWKPVSWDEAINFVATRLTRIRAESGPDAIGMLGSSRATNEENYLAQKFARVVVGTNNVDCCARVCHTPSAAGLKMILGTGAATNSFDDIESARTILICGANPTENHPIVGARIKQAALRGADLIVIDPRRIELAEVAKVHLQLRPGTNILLLNAIACTIVEEGLYDANFVNDHLDGWHDFQSFIQDFSPERVALACGLEARLIREAARLYARQKPAICFHGLGMTEHVQGTEGVMSLVNLALLTGNIGKPGTGINPLRGQNNVQGAAHMGCDPGILTGGVPLSEHRERFEKVWGVPIPSQRGLSLLQMIDAAAVGRLKALWVIGYDIALTNPNSDQTLRALQSLDLVIVQDMFLNETARLVGTVFLPASSSFEKLGTFMNSERRIQLVRPAIPPVGESRPDWLIISDIAVAMGKAEGFTFESAQQIWDEIRSVWPVGAGITYQRLEKQGLQWPCPTEVHPGTSILHADLAGKTRRVSLRCIKFEPTPEKTSDEFPFLLTTGRSLYQFNAGTMTSRSKMQKIRPTDLLLISPDDAKRLSIEDHQEVELRSSYGKIRIPAVISERVRLGELFATFHSPQIFLNRLTGPHKDRHVQTPEYKVTAVQVSAV